MDADVESENVTASSGTAPTSCDTVDLQRNLRLRRATSVQQASSTTVGPSSGSEDSLGTEAAMPTGDRDSESSSRRVHRVTTPNRGRVPVRRDNSKTYHFRSTRGIIIFADVSNVTVNRYTEEDGLETTEAHTRNEEIVGHQNRRRHRMPSRTPPVNGQPSSQNPANITPYESLVDTTSLSNWNLHNRQGALRSTQGPSTPTHFNTEVDEEYLCTPVENSLGDTIDFSGMNIDSPCPRSLHPAAHRDHIQSSDAVQEQTNPKQLAGAAVEQTLRSEVSPQEVEADCPQSSNGETYRMIVLGKTGSGKSSTGNTILGSKKFKSSIMSTSETENCQLERAIRNGVNLEVSDTPGLCDLSKTNTELIARITQALLSMHPGPDVFLNVIAIGRYTPEDYDTYNRLMQFLNDDVKKRMILVFTHGDKLVQENISIEEYLENAQKELTQVLEECGNRYVVFDNRSENNEQVDVLLQKIQEIIAEIGVSHYSTDIASMLKKADMSEVRGGSVEGHSSEMSSPLSTDQTIKAEQNEDEKSWRGLTETYDETLEWAKRQKLARLDWKRWLLIVVPIVLLAVGVAVVFKPSAPAIVTAVTRLLT